MNAAAQSVAQLVKSKVLVGIPASAGPHPGSKASNALIGYVQNYGDDALHIPARPFLQPGVAAATDAITPPLKKAAEAALRGDASGIDQALNRVGLICQNAVQQKLTEGPFAPLKASTLAARRAHGRTGTKPLIDTGALRRSLTYVIAKG